MKRKNNGTQDSTSQPPRSFGAWLGELREFMKGRFSLDEDKAQRDEVVASVSKGVEFRGVNLWVLIFATMIASLGLNVNSAAVIIGAMLISPIMGPIMGVGLSLGINDFELLKKSLAQPGADVHRRHHHLDGLLLHLAALVEQQRAAGAHRAYDLRRADRPVRRPGGHGGADAAGPHVDRHSRRGHRHGPHPAPSVRRVSDWPRDRSASSSGPSTSFFINSVFIALATYLVVRFLGYEKKVFIDKSRERNVKRLMMVITLVTFIPSVVIGFHMVRVSVFEAVADKYVAQVFNFPHTRVIECNKHYAQGDRSSRGSSCCLSASRWARR